MRRAMKRCRLIPATILGLTLTTSVLAQQPSPFAPPATLMAPVPASPAQQIFADPQPPPYPYAQPFRPPQPIQPGGPYQPRQADQCEGLLVGLQLGLVRPSLGGYIAAGPLNVAVPVSVLLGWQFPTTTAGQIGR